MDMHCCTPKQGPCACVPHAVQRTRHPGLAGTPTPPPARRQPTAPRPGLATQLGSTARTNRRAPHPRSLGGVAARCLLATPGAVACTAAAVTTRIAARSLGHAQLRRQLHPRLHPRRKTARQPAPCGLGAPRGTHRTHSPRRTTALDRGTGSRPMQPQRTCPPAPQGAADCHRGESTLRTKRLECYYFYSYWRMINNAPKRIERS